jgi:hypothetical protein
MPTQASSEEMLSIAKQYYLNGYAHSITEAARVHDVKEWTLRARLKGVGPRSERPVHGKKHCNDWEAGLLRHLEKMDDIGFPLPPEAITTNANMILSQNHIDPTTEPEPVGQTWALRFLKRYSDKEFLIRNQETLDLARFRAHQPATISLYFEKLQAALKKYNIRLEDLYNMDKTGFRIGVGGRKKVVTRNSRRRAYAPSSTNRNFVTVVECVSADRNFIPPMVILPGKNVMEVWVTKTGLPEDFGLAVSDSGYLNDDLCMQWLKHFEYHSAKRQVGEYRMLIIDGYGSHCTLDFICFCEEHKIVPFCLPSHTTHLLQPLDVVLFHSYKKEHRDTLHKAMFSCCANFNKVEFLHAPKGMRQRAFRELSIASAFRKTGFVPFHPKIVLDMITADSAKTPVPLPSPASPSNNNAAPSTPTTA